MGVGADERDDTAIEAGAADASDDTAIEDGAADANDDTAIEADVAGAEAILAVCCGTMREILGGGRNLDRSGPG